MLNKIDCESWAVAICIGGGGLLCAALFMEFAMGLAPCPLCMMQRIWLALLVIISFVGLTHNPRLGIYPLSALIAGVVGAGFSIRQLWLQSLPKDQVPACGPDLAYMIDAFPLSDLIAAMTSGTGDCANVSWSLLGLSIPGWLLLCFIALCAACLLQLMRSIRPLLQ